MLLGGSYLRRRDRNHPLDWTIVLQVNLFIDSAGAEVYPVNSLFEYLLAIRDGQVIGEF
jgi:hypothetical protein